MKKVLVTGDKGFIGKRVAEQFYGAGWNVDGCDYNEAVPNVSGYDLVIHLGAISSTNNRDAEAIYKQNYQYSIDLMNSCLIDNVHFQYASSASVYGTNTNFEEDSPKNPQSGYAWSKFYLDQYAEKVMNYPTSSIIQGFRYFNVYGAGEEHKLQPSPITFFTNQAKETGIIKVFEDSANFKRDFINVFDICSLHLALAERPESGIFNVGTGSTVSFQEVAIQIAEKYGAEVVEVPMPNDIKDQYQKYTCADLTKLNKIIPHKDWCEWTVAEYIDNAL